MATVSALNTYMAAAQSALSAGNYNDARLQATLAMGELSVIPDGGKGDANLTWSREGIEKFLEQVDRVAIRTRTAQSGGFGAVPIRYVKEENL